MAMYLLIAGFVAATAAQYATTVIPDPLVACGGVLGAIETQCATAAGCCEAGPCCAGGCCPLTAVCLNSGTNSELCCNAGDQSMCGYYTAPTKTATCGGDSGGFHASVPCSGLDDSWLCPYGSTCNPTILSGCNPGFAIEEACTSSGPDNSGTSTFSEPFAGDSTTTQSDNFVDSTTTTDFGKSSTSSPTAFGGGSTTASSTSSPQQSVTVSTPTPTHSNAAAIGRSGDSSFGLVILCVAALLA